MDFVQSVLAQMLWKCARLVLSKGYSSQFILEGDIKSCFDKISHQWLRDNITMDKGILNKWLAAGFIDKDPLYPTDSGTPQGGIASPTLLNLTLSGLEDTVIRATSKRKDKVHVVTYADDFIITGSSKEGLCCENNLKLKFYFQMLLCLCSQSK